MNRICPKCGCVFRDGRNECRDCGSYTRPASEEELLRFENRNLRMLSHTAADTDNARLRPWQPIAAGLLVAYGTVTALLFRGVFGKLLLFDLIAAVILLVPVLNRWEMLFDWINRGFASVSYRYYYRSLLIFLIFAAALNVWCTCAVLFAETV